MIPIFEQGTGKGIGHDFDSFSQRFDAICEQHVSSGRARAFAFIFYDFQDSALRRILKDQGVFAKLDRLSGTELSIFYLHAGTFTAIEKFNQQFLAALGVIDQAQLPCIVFFKINNNEIYNLQVVQLDNADLIHGFQELYTIVECYLATNPTGKQFQSSALKWIRGGSIMVSLETFRAILRRGLEFLI